MTGADKLKYFGVSDLSQLKPGYTYTWIDTLNAEERMEIRPEISLRSSYNCGVNVEMYFSGSGDTATVTAYEANTNTIVHGPVDMAHGDNFDMTINGSKDYDFKVEPFEDPINSMFGNFIVDPDWGGKSIYSFSGSGSYLFEDYQFEGPAPTDGTCDAYVAVYHLSGIATKYTLKVIPDVGIPFEVGPILGDDSEVDFEIDEDRTYEFEIKAEDGGTSESFSIQIIRPDNVAHHKSFYGVDMSVPNPYLIVFSYVFDYFDCPY